MTREEAIRRIKAWNLDSDDMEVLAVVIPELAESEDERIRKWIVKFLVEQYPECWKDKKNKMLSYLEKQKEQEHICDSAQYEEGFKIGRETGLRDGQKYVLDNLESYGLCKPAEWSEDDEDKVEGIIWSLECLKDWIRKYDADAKHNPSFASIDKEIGWLKSLRPSWKPSEEQMEALLKTLHPDDPYYTELKSIYEHLEKL